MTAHDRIRNPGANEDVGVNAGTDDILTKRISQRHRDDEDELPAGRFGSALLLISKRVEITVPKVSFP